MQCYVIQHYSIQYRVLHHIIPAVVRLPRLRRKLRLRGDGFLVVVVVVVIIIITIIITIVSLIIMIIIIVIVAVIIVVIVVEIIVVIN